MTVIVLCPAFWEQHVSHGTVSFAEQLSVVDSFIALRVFVTVSAVNVFTRFYLILSCHFRFIVAVIEAGVWLALVQT